MREQFAALDPMSLLKTVRAAQQESLTLSSHEASSANSINPPKSPAAFATSWHSDYHAPKGRRKKTAKHWWRTRVDPFADSWSLVEGSAGGTPTSLPQELLTRLIQHLPDSGTA